MVSGPFFVRSSRTMIDPMDTMALNQIEDMLDLQCFCGARSKFDPYCPIHGRDQSVFLRAIKDFEDTAGESKKEEAEQKVSELDEELTELQEEHTKLERSESRLTGMVDDLKYAIEQALVVLMPPAVGVRKAPEWETKAEEAKKLLQETLNAVVRREKDSKAT